MLNKHHHPYSIKNTSIQNIITESTTRTNNLICNLQIETQHFFFCYLLICIYSFIFVTQQQIHQQKARYLYEIIFLFLRGVITEKVMPQKIFFIYKLLKLTKFNFYYSKKNKNIHIYTYIFLYNEGNKTFVEFIKNLIVLDKCFFLFHNKK